MALAFAAEFSVSNVRLVYGQNVQSELETDLTVEAVAKNDPELQTKLLSTKTIVAAEVASIWAMAPPLVLTVALFLSVAALELVFSAIEGAL